MNNSRLGNFLFYLAIEKLKLVRGSVVVEIGSIRDLSAKASLSDGHSTLAWARAGLEVHTVDRDAKTHLLVCELTENYKEVHAYHGDGLQFVKDFVGEMDLLYLDGPDSESSLVIFSEAQHKLRSHSFVLIDDRDVENSAVSILPSADSMGFRIVVDNGRQILLERR